MDVVGILGYIGQEIHFLDPENFGFILGNSFSVYHITKGARDMIWRTDGISAFASHSKHQIFAVASNQSSSIDLIDSASLTLIASLKNPTQSRVKKLQFSHEGTRLIALTDFCDHSVFVWDLEKKLIVCQLNLSVRFSSCLFNPYDDTSFCLYGNEGIYLAKISEMLGKHTIKLEPIKVPQVVDAEGSTTNLLTSPDEKVPTFGSSLPILHCQWILSDKILVVMQDGSLALIQISDLTSHSLGTLPHPLDSSRPCLLSCFALALSSFIVGTQEGEIFWFGADLFSLLRTPLAALRGTLQNLLPVFQQTGLIEGAVTYLTVDPGHDTLLLSSSSGALSRCPVHPAPAAVVDPDLAAGDDLLGGDGTGLAFDPRNQQTAKIEEIIDFSNGSILLTQSLCVPVLRLDSNSKGTALLPLFITGSHFGEISFWRAPPVESELVVNGGLRRAAPHELRLVNSVMLENTEPPISNHNHSLSSQDSSSLVLKNGQQQQQQGGGGREGGRPIKNNFPIAISAMQVFVNTRQQYILVVGTTSGWIEIFNVSAREVEEDEVMAGGGNGDNNGDAEGGAGSIEDDIFDDDGSLLKLDIVNCFRSSMFPTSLSLLSIDASGRLIATGSHLQQIFFVLGAISPTKYDVMMKITLSTVERPISCSWGEGTTLWVCCDGGSILSCNNLSFKSEDASSKPGTPAQGASLSRPITPGDGLITAGASSAIPVLFLESAHNTWFSGLSQISNSIFLPPDGLLVWTTDFAGLRIYKTPEPSRLINHSASQHAAAAAQSVASFASPSHSPTPSIEDSSSSEQVHPRQSTPNLTSTSTLVEKRFDYVDYISFGEQFDIVSSVAVSIDKVLVAVGCIDGSIHLYKLTYASTPTIPINYGSYSPPSSPTGVTPLNHLSLFSSPVISLSFAPNSTLLFATSSDGASFVLTVDKPIKLNVRMLRSVNDFKQNIDNKPFFASKPWLDRSGDIELVLMKHTHANKISEIIFTVENISQRLQTLLERNETRNPLEQMEREEFVVDLHGRSQFLAETEEMSKKLQENYRQKNLYQELLAARIRSACYDPMEHKSRSLYPFLIETNGTFPPPMWTKSVSSFAIRAYSHEEKVTLDRVKRLRATEMLAQRSQEDGIFQRIPNLVAGATAKSRTAWASSVLGCPPNVSWIANDGSKWPSADVVAREQAEAALLALPPQGQGVASSTNATEKKDSKEVDPKGVVASTAAGGNNANVALQEEEDHGMDPQEREVDENDVFSLLYPPVAVRSQIQKRAQLLLLKDIGRTIRSKFNEYFEKLYNEKQDVVAAIQSRSTRIKAIILELKLDEPVSEPTWDETEIIGSCLKVNDSELISKPYETQAARAIRLKEEEIRKKLEEEKNRDNVQGRALEDMMHGTLEVKRDVFAEASSLVKPEWMMTTPTSEMSETQLKEVEAFENKFKELQEEQAKYKKSLELELKKLRTEIQEICKNFDEKLNILSQNKVIVLREILSMELYSSRIAHGMASREHAWNLLLKINGEIDQSRSERSELKKKAAIFQQQVEEVRLKLNANIEEERGLEKSFKREIQNLCNQTFDQDSLKLLASLYKIRVYSSHEEEEPDEGDEGFGGSSSAGVGNQGKGGPGGRSSRGSKNGNKRSKDQLGGSKSKLPGGAAASKARASAKAQSSNNSKDAGHGRLGPMQAAAQALKNAEEGNVEIKDPLDLELAKYKSQRKDGDAPVLPLNLPLTIENDCPDGFDLGQAVMSKLNELRSERIEKEIQTKILTVEHQSLRSKLDSLKSDESQLDRHISSLKDSRNKLIDTLQGFANNLDVMVCLRQGQDEVDKDAVVTDYSDAALLPVEVVQRFNSRIRELSKEKIGVLNKIKLFRRKINLIDWETSYLRLKKKHGEEYFSDLQLLRVTRELQQVIREGSDPELSKARVERIVNRKDFLQRDAFDKLHKLRKQKEILSRQLADRQEEISSLEAKIEALKAQVDTCKVVQQNRDVARGVDEDSLALITKRMKKIAGRRQLVDLAKAQAEEIDFLRQELDKLRQRTFPSFVRATKTRLPGL